MGPWSLELLERKARVYRKLKRKAAKRHESFHAYVVRLAKMKLTTRNK